MMGTFDKMFSPQEVSKTLSSSTPSSRYLSYPVTLFVNFPMCVKSSSFENCNIALFLAFSNFHPITCFFIQVQVQGTVAEGLDPVMELFEEQFKKGEELSAQVGWQL